MWIPVLAGWFGISVLLAILHHRFRQMQQDLHPDVEEFLIRFEASLGRYRHVEYMGLLPGQFTALLRVHGQETPVSLHEAFRHAKAFPEAFTAMVDRLIKDVEEVGLDGVADFDFATVATWVLPQIRSRKWVEQQGCFGDSGLVYRVLTDDLAVVYVIDDAQAMVFVCRAHLQSWQKREPDLYNLAIANLHRLGTAGLEKVTDVSSALLLQSGDGYDAARVLLLEQNVNGLLVAIPDRDVLWVGQEQGQDLAGLMATTEEIARTSRHPVSSAIYRVKSGRLESVSG